MRLLLCLVFVFLTIVNVYFAAAGILKECLRWVQTNNCDPHGLKNNVFLPCDAVIDSGLSGYCECENRRRVKEVTCDHHTFTCKSACEDHHSGSLEYPEGFEAVTCGSTIKLINENSRFRLHSHEINYGTGSGQQSVTAHGSRDDTNSYWIVKEGDQAPACLVGDVIKCGSTIRLEHLTTKRNLHTHQFQSPLSRNQEVSGFGVAGDGDIGDNWIVQCEDKTCDAKTTSCKNNDNWNRYSLIYLKNEQTGKLLNTSPKYKFDDSNCPRCPINGQLEVSATNSKTDENLWYADEGIYIAAN